MMSRRGILGLIAGMGAFALAGCGSRGRSLRFRMSIDVAIPGGERSGGSVLECVSRPGNGFQYSGGSWVIGQAPMVNLGDGRYLFALLRGPYEHGSIAGTLLKVLRSPDLQPLLTDPNASAFAQAEATKPYGVVPPGDYPSVVSFRDLKNSKSVFEVDPGNISSAFGPGYYLRRIAIQVVGDEEPLTEGIEEVLPWLGPHPETLLDDEFYRSNPPLARTLSNGNFVFRKS